MNHWLPLECFIVAVLSLAVASDCEVVTAEPPALCAGCDGLEECRVDYARKQVFWPKGLSKSRKTDGVGLHSSNDEPHPRHGPATEIEDFRNNNYIRANESGSKPGKPCQQYNEVKHCMQKQNIKSVFSWHDSVLECAKEGGSLSVFRSREEHELLVKLAKNFGLKNYDKFWVNGHRVGGKSFQWLPSKKIIPSNQFDGDTGEPCANCDKSCAAIELNRRIVWMMASNFCHAEMHYVCQFKV